MFVPSIVRRETSDEVQTGARNDMHVRAWKGGLQQSLGHLAIYAAEQLACSVWNAKSLLETYFLAVLQGGRRLTTMLTYAFRERMLCSILE